MPLKAACAPLCALCVCVILYQNTRIPLVICISSVIATPYCINHSQGTAGTRVLKLHSKSRSIITKKKLIVIIKTLDVAWPQDQSSKQQKTEVGQNLKKKKTI